MTQINTDKSITRKKAIIIGFITGLFISLVNMVTYMISDQSINNHTCYIITRILGTIGRLLEPLIFTNPYNYPGSVYDLFLVSRFVLIPVVACGIIAFFISAISNYIKNTITLYNFIILVIFTFVSINIICSVIIKMSWSDFFYDGI